MAIVFGLVAFIGLLGCIVPHGWLVEHGTVSFDISPDGQEIVFVSADSDLFLLHLQTLQVSQLTKTAAKEETPAFSPDGESIAYATTIDGREGTCLFVRSLDSKEVRQLTSDPGTNDSMPSYSSDGSRIVFARAHRHRPYSMGGWTWDDWDLYVIKSDGTQLRRVTQQKSYGVGSPKFLPDGSHIVYSAAPDRTRGPSPTILVADVSGEQPPRPLTNDYAARKQGGAWASAPDVSSDGRSITFISDRVKPYHYDVFIMNRDGTAPRPLGLTTISRYNQHPAFLPDGRSLLFLAGKEWNAESRPIFSLWQMDADGKNPRCIAESELFTHPLRWKPNR